MIYSAIKGLTARLCQGMGVALMAFLLAGCDPAENTLAAMLGTTSEQREQFIRDGFDNPTVSGKAILSSTALYIDWEDYRSLVVDDESFLRYGLGLYLARNPQIDYDFAKAFLGGGNEVPMTRERFQFYKGWGEFFLDDLKSKPENTYLLEREKLFFARTGLGPIHLERMNPGQYATLLKDDEAFNRFLSDDEFAVATLPSMFSGDFWEENFGDPMNDPYKIGPKYFGVTPGTGS